jgi:hypothetical protein
MWKSSLLALEDALEKAAWEIERKLPEGTVAAVVAFESETERRDAGSCKRQVCRIHSVIRNKIWTA